MEKGNESDKYSKSRSLNNSGGQNKTLWVHNDWLIDRTISESWFFSAFP